MSDSEVELVQRIKAGESDALVMFIEKRKPQLLAFIEKNASDSLRRKIESTDLLQEVTISALGSVGDVELGDRDPFSWLCQLAERRIIDAHRRLFGAKKRSAEKEVGLLSTSKDPDQKGFIDVLVASMTSPSKAFSRNQREFHLLAALDSLPEESREALKMRYVENLPSKEIATRLGKTDGATRVLLTRSLSKLQAILGSNSLFQSFRSDKPPAE